VGSFSILIELEVTDCILEDLHKLRAEFEAFGVDLNAAVQVAVGVWALVACSSRLSS
jgi:hypothetical protein